MPRSFHQCRVSKTRDHEFVCVTWFERDRQNVRLETPRGKLIFNLWDDRVTDAIESGLLTVPQRPRPNDTDWQPHAVAYARDIGLL